MGGPSSNCNTMVKGGIEIRKGEMTSFECQALITRQGLWHLLKIFLFNQQLDADFMDWDELDDIEILTEYIALLHVPYFLQSPLAVAAPRLDRDFP